MSIFQEPITFKLLYDVSDYLSADNQFDPV